MGFFNLFSAHKKSTKAIEVQKTPNERFLEAASEGDIKQVQEFIDSGIDVNVKWGFGPSALFRAALQGHTAVVKLLIDNEADVNSENSHHETAIFYACSNTHPEVVKVLIDNGAHVNAKMKCGDTPLMYACHGVLQKYRIAKMFNHTVDLGEIAPIIEIMKMLIESGADVNAENNAGESVNMYAEKHSLTLITNFLKNTGAKQIDLSASAPTAQIEIVCDIKTVWTFLITEKNWAKWHGPVPTVEPGWQDGASLIWPNGDESIITGFKRYEELVTESTRIKTIIRLRKQSATLTALEMITVPIGGAEFSDGGTAQELSLESCLMKFKNNIENA